MPMGDGRVIGISTPLCDGCMAYITDITSTIACTVQFFRCRVTGRRARTACHATFAPHTVGPTHARAAPPIGPRRIMALAVLVALALARGALADRATCAACAQAVTYLAKAYNHTEAELELSKEANDKKAQKIDKVQKAQTKRWLKQEYGVALRAAVEEEMEALCGRPSIASNRELKAACVILIEQQDEELARAILDEKSDGFCASVVPGCEGDQANEAVAAYAVGMLPAYSEPEPRGEHAKKVRGVVTRLVGSTYAFGIHDSKAHVLVLVHNGSALAERQYQVSDARFTALVDEFYALAAEAKSERYLQCMQLDLSANKLPPNVPVPPDGFGLVLHLLGAREEPKAMPDRGEDSLAMAEPATVSS